MAVEPHRPHAGIFLQLGFPYNSVIALVGAPDLILGLPVSARDQVDNLVAAPPNIVGCTILSIADGQTYSIAVWSHGELLFGRLSKTIAGIVCHQDQPCTMTRCTAMESPTRVVFNARTVSAHINTHQDGHRRPAVLEERIGGSFSSLSSCSGVRVRRS